MTGLLVAQGSHQTLDFVSLDLAPLLTASGDQYPESNFQLLIIQDPDRAAYHIGSCPLVTYARH